MVRNGGKNGSEKWREIGSKRFHFPSTFHFPLSLCLLNGDHDVRRRPMNSMRLDYDREHHSVVYNGLIRHDVVAGTVGGGVVDAILFFDRLLGLSSPSTHE